MVALCEVYRGGGFAGADFTVLEHSDLGASHSFANVHWTLRRADGSVLQAFRTAYQVELGPERVQAVVPAGVRQRAEPVDGEVLVSCVVSPGFEWSGFELG